MVFVVRERVDTCTQKDADLAVAFRKVIQTSRFCVRQVSTRLHVQFDPKVRTTEVKFDLNNACENYEPKVIDFKDLTAAINFYYFLGEIVNLKDNLFGVVWTVQKLK